MSSTGSRHLGRRRLAAATAFVLVLAVAVGTLIRVVKDPGRVLLELVTQPTATAFVQDGYGG